MVEKTIPGFTFTGDYVNGFPLYEMNGPKDGRPDINTLEGWTLHCIDGIRKRLFRTLGREPSEAELNAEEA